MYDNTDEKLADLLQEIKNLHERHEFASEIRPDYYEPGKMEYLEQSEGLYNEDDGTVLLRFESKGVRYEGRTERIETVKEGTPLTLRRDPENPYNSNNFLIFTPSGKDIGNMPAALCNAIAPLYDEGRLLFDDAFVSFVEPLSKRSRHAKQAMLFVELHAHLEEPQR